MPGKNATATDVGLLVLRAGLGLIVLYYGLQHALGLFGGKGFSGTLDTWQSVRNVPPWLGTLAVISELAGGLALLAGILTRVAAFGVACTMIGAVYINTIDPGALDALLSGSAGRVQSYAYPFALAIMAISVLLIGAGRLSLDMRLFGRGR